MKAASAVSPEPARTRGGRWSAEEERAFAVEITAVNLRRCKFAAVAGAAISGWSAILSLFLPELRFGDFRGWLLTCVGLYAVLLALRSGVRRPGVSERVRQAYVLAFFVALVGVCDGFFLVLSQQLTAVSSFSRGMLVTAVVFVLPPRRYLPVAAVNEALLCAWLVWRGLSGPTLTAFLDGTAGAVVGSVVSWTLYMARRADFRQERLIRRQHGEMNELMAVTAHDLRSPLLGVRNLLTLALARTGLDRERLLGVIGDAARACDRMLGLVNGLVDAHAAEASAVELRMADGDLRDSVAAAIERARPVAEAKGQRLERQLPEAPAGARFDAAALGQALDNLLGNALKFSPPGATVETLVRRSATGGWHVEIRDRGPGVPEEERSQLFRKHARGSAQPTGGESSSGLGLFIVRTLAERMGARAAYAPREGGGSVFRLEWPAA